MGCVNAICTGLAALARLVDVETAQFRVCPQPPQTQSCRRLAIPVASVVTSDLRGNDSHGVSNMLRNYIEGFLRGRPDRGYKIGGRIYDCNPRPCFKTIRDR